MSALLATISVALATNLRRLTTWIFAAVFVGIVLLLYLGPLRFGGMTASGVKLATNADFTIAVVLAAFSFMLMHFTATLTGDPVVQDARLGTAPLIASTPVGARTYLLGRFLGGYLSLLAIYAVFLVALVLGQLLPQSGAKLTLDFRLWPYLKFALLFVLVPTFFVGALSFAVGTLTGSMKTVYVAVTGLLVSWFLVVEALGEEHLRWLAYVEPSGQAWLVEKVAKDRGNTFLNEHAITPDAGLLINRGVLVLCALAALGWTVRRWRGNELDVEFSGEVGPTSLERLKAWVRGRPAALNDPYAVWSGEARVPRVEPAPRGPRTWLAQLGGSLACETRLLLAERSLWIMVPMIMLLAGVDSISHVGPFNVAVYPVSSEFAQQMVPVLLILLAGTTIFYTGEVFHRDDENGVRPILYASPIANSALLLSKLGAMLAVSLGMVLLTILTALVSQAVQWYLIDGRLYLDLVPYGPVLAQVLLPAVVVLCAVSLAVNVLTRGRYLAYFANIVLAAGYIWLLIEGERALYLNPFALGHWVYSDLLGMQPFAERLAWHRAYWGCVALALTALSAWFLQRGQGSRRQYLSRAALRARPFGPLLAALGTAGALWCGLEIQARGNVGGTRAELERAAIELERTWAPRLYEPRLAYTRVDVDVELDLERRRVDVRGTLELENPYERPLESAVFRADALFELRRFELDGAHGAPRRDGDLLELALERPLPPGAKTTLRLDWGGPIGPGWAADGGGQNTFVHRDAVFLSYFAGHLVPLPGVDPGLFVLDRERRAELGLEPFEPMRDPPRGSWAGGAFGSDLPFDLEARILAPARLDVLSGGELVERTERGELALSTFRTREPVASFAILAGDYERRAVGQDEIHHHAAHTYNLETIQTALADAREVFARRFGPYPHGLLRIAEFPRLAGFAQSYPTLMPYSESIGFLTHHADDPRDIDATYFVTAHEVAHQWWGYLASPAARPGAQVLSESLAEYSALLLIDERRGERERLVFLQQEEDAYLRRRAADTELPLARLQLEGDELWYHKGALVLYMLERRIGREALCAALARFVADFRQGVDAQGARRGGHPGLDDLRGRLREARPDVDLEPFFADWFDAVVLPELTFDGRPQVRDEGGSWTVEFTAVNRGEGRVQVRVEAVAGEWRAERRAADDVAHSIGEALEISLGPGESVRGMVTARFEPDALVIDRLHETIDFDRSNNVLGL
jgi:ABC-2 type transport system permease protein